ncbi:MAG: patatin-like phospholipase family protein [Bacteroidota bacterium]
MSGIIPKPKYFRILSIDGGGIRGIIPGQILIVIENKLREKTRNPESRLADYFDLIAGTGTGGIMACAYLSPVKPQLRTPRFTAAQVVDIYLKFGAKVFNDTLDHRILTMGGLLDEKYTSEGLERLLLDYFNELQLSHLLKPSLITAYDVTKRKAHFFTQHTADKPASDYYVRDVARATSASPTFFECERIQSLSGVSYPLIDGSVFANNPAMCAYIEARKVLTQEPNRPNVGTPADIVMLSMGTGVPKAQYEYDDVKGWGVTRWARPLLDISSAGNSETVDYQLKHLFEAAKVRKQYMRINPTLTIDVKAEMDNTSNENLRALKELGEYMAEEQDEKLDAFIELLLAEQSIMAN